MGRRRGWSWESGWERAAGKEGGGGGWFAGDVGDAAPLLSASPHRHNDEHNACARAAFMHLIVTCIRAGSCVGGDLGSGDHSPGPTRHQHPSADLNALHDMSTTSRAAAKAEAKKHARPVTPYANYVSANFARVSASAPDAKTTDVVKLISAEWKKLPDNKKSSLLSEYREKLAAWKAINEPTV
eukprot:364100-Chlamydomonas_euryale.AAC.48